jgi:hypothetical protein
MEDIVSLKIMFIFLIFFSASLSGLIPIFLKSFKNNSTLISVGNCFAGGFFISRSSSSNAQNTFNEVAGDKMPIEYVFSMGGYLLILYMEKLLFLDRSNQNEKSTLDSNENPTEVMGTQLHHDFNDKILKRKTKI